MLTHVLQNNVKSTYTVCDTFCGVQQLDGVAETTHVTSLTRKRFDYNVHATETSVPLILYPEFSSHMFVKIFQKIQETTSTLNNNMYQKMLLPNIQEAGGAKAEVEQVEAEVEQKRYDIIYVDGSHVACDVLLDAVCSFTLLSVRKNLMVFFFLNARRRSFPYIPYIYLN